MNKLWLFLLLALASPARAAPVDMSSQTCQDWLDASEDEQDQMVAWLRGALSAKTSSTLFDASGARGDALMLKLYCQSHLKVGLLSAAAQWKR